MDSELIAEKLPEQQNIEPKQRSVFLPEYGITVRTDLKNPNEIKFSTDTSILKQSKDMYFALGRLGESKKDFSNGVFNQMFRSVGATGANMVHAGFTGTVNMARTFLNHAGNVGALEGLNNLYAREKISKEEFDATKAELEEDFKNAEKRREEWSLKQQQELDKFLASAGLDKTQFDGFTYDLFSGVGSVAAAFAVGALTKSPAAVMSMFGIVSGQQNYNEALAAGVKGNKALAIGLSTGIVEGGLEAIGTEWIFKAVTKAGIGQKSIREIVASLKMDGIKGIAAATGEGLLSEGLQESAQSFAQDMIMQGTGVREADFEGAIEEALYQGLVGALVGGGFAAVGRTGLTLAAKFEKLGLPPETAKKTALNTMRAALNQDNIKQAINVVNLENSPLTYKNADMAQSAAEFREVITQLKDPAEKAKAAKEIWDIGDKIKAVGKEVGLPQEQQEAMARSYQQAATLAYENANILPKDWFERCKLKITNDMKQSLSGALDGQKTTYNQAAAMYKNKAKTLTEFKAFAIQNKNNEALANKSYYRIEGVVKIDVPFERANHINERHAMTTQQWQVIEDNLKSPQIDSFSILPKAGSQYNGSKIMFKMVTAEGKAGVVVEVSPSGRIFLDTAFFDTDKNIDTWIKKNPSVMPTQSAVSNGRGKYSLQEIVEFVNTTSNDNNTLYQSETATENLFKPTIAEKIKYAEDLKRVAAGKLKSGQLIRVGKTPRVYLEIGLPEGSLNLPVNTLKKSTTEKHNIKMADIKKLPELVYNPIMVFKSITAQDSFVAVVDAQDDSGRQVVVILKPTNKGINIIPSIYGRDNFNNFIKRNIESGNLLYADNKKAANLVRPQGLQLPKGNKVNDSINNIQTKDDIIKTFYQSETAVDNLFKPTVQEINAYKQEFAAALENSTSESTKIAMGRLPFLYKLLGFSESELKTNKKTLLKALGYAGRNPHNVSKEVLEKLPELTADPVAVFKSLSTAENPNGYVAVLDAKVDGKPVIAIISPSKDGKGFAFIPTVYERNNFDNLIKNTAEEGKILYIKEKGSEMWGTLQSRPRHIRNLNNNIQTKDDIIKTFYQSETATENLFKPTSAENAKYKADLQKALSGQLAQDRFIVVGKTPTLYQGLGLNKGSLNLPINVINKATKIKHNVQLQAIENLPKLIANPILIFKSTTEENSLVAVLNQKDTNGEQVIAILKPVGDKINVIPSVYGKSNFDNFISKNIENNNLIYADMKQASKTIRQNELQLLKRDSLKGSINNIQTKDDIIKTFYQKEATARASITFTPQGAFMHLLETAGPDSIVHEIAGHVLLRTVEDIRAVSMENGGATKEFAKIWEDLENWLGKAQKIEKDGQVEYRFSTEQQETFAYGMEKFFEAGKAPTTALQRIFEYFRTMLKDLYTEAREWLDLRPEVEDIFSRLFAETEIAADSKTFKGRAADIKAIAEKAKKGEATTINGMGIKEVKTLLQQLNRRRPAMPKEDLLKTLKRKGADFDNAAKIDKEAYQNAAIKNDKTGIQDDLSAWLADNGYMAQLGERLSYEEKSRLEEQAADLIDRALAGEKIYKLEDASRLDAVQNFDNNIESIREAFGNNISVAEETLRAITDLEVKGYRIVGNSDIQLAEGESDKLLTFAEREAELKAKIEKLTEDKEVLGNIAERRLKEISRSAQESHKTGYAEAIKDAKDKETVRSILEVEREAYKNALDAKRVRNALVKEVEKRELENKEEWLKPLREAKGVEEILSAARHLTAGLNMVYKASAAGRAEKLKVDLPKTDWHHVKLQAIEGFRLIAAEADEKIYKAQKLDAIGEAARRKGQHLTKEEYAEIESARSGVLKGYATQYSKALIKAFDGIGHINPIWLEKAAASIGRQYSGRSNILGQALDNLIERAVSEQKKNYKKYIYAKTEAMISAGYKTKDGQKQKGKYDYATNKLFEDLAHIKNMDKTAAKHELRRRRKIISEAKTQEEVVNKIMDLNMDEQNVSGLLIDNMRLENMYLTFKTGKMSESEMLEAKASLAEQGLPDTIGDDAYAFITPELLHEFYNTVNERRKAAYEGRLSDAQKLAQQEIEERQAFAGAVRKNDKAGIIGKGYASLIANWESILNLITNNKIKEKYSLLEFEAQAEVKTSEKMKEVFDIIKKALNTQDAAKVKQWSDGLDVEAGVFKNRIESKRKALSDAVPQVLSSMDAIKEFQNLVSGKNEIVLKDFLAFADDKGEFKKNNLKIIYGDNTQGLKKIADQQGLDGVMKAVHAATNGLIVKYFADRIHLRVRNDFEAVLKKSSPGGKDTYSLIDYALYDDKGKQIGGYGIDKKEGGLKIEIPADIEPVISITGEEIESANDFKTFKTRVIDWYKKYFSNEKSNRKDLGEISYPMASAREISGKFASIDKLKFVPAIKAVVDNGVLLPTVKQTPWRKDGIIKFYYIQGKVNINGEDCFLQVDIAERKDGKKFYYFSELGKKEAFGAEHTFSKRRAEPKANNSIYENNESVNPQTDPKDEAFDIKKSALAAAQNALNPYFDGLYKPVEQKLTKGEIIDFYNTAKNATGYVRLENQYGADQLAEMFNTLTPEDKQIADAWQKIVEGGYAEVNKVFIRQYGLDMGHPEKYWPFSVERITSELDMLAQNNYEAKRPGMTKTRTIGQLVEMKPTNPIEKLYGHYSRAAQYIETAEKVDWIRRVLRNSALKKTVQDHMGDNILKTMYELLDNSTMGLSQKSVKHYEDGIMDWLTNNYVKSAIAAKPSIAIKQLISVINYSENMPAEQWATGFASALSNYKETIDFMMQDPYLKTRWENGTQNEALTRALAKDFSKNKTIKNLNSFSNIMTINVRLGDIGAIIFGGKPYLDYLMKTKGMSKEEAFNQFRLDTLRSQQASQRSALSRLQAKDMNWLMRALFAFKNTQNQYVRKIADAIIMYKRGEIDGRQLAKTIAVYGVINQYLYVAATSLGLLTLGLSGGDDKDEALNELFLWMPQNFGFLPILDDAVNQASYTMINLIREGKIRRLRNPEVPIFKDIYEAINSVNKDDLSFADWVNFTAPIGQIATGLPVKYALGGLTTGAEIAHGNVVKAGLKAAGYTENRAAKATGEKK